MRSTDQVQHRDVIQMELIRLRSVSESDFLQSLDCLSLSYSGLLEVMCSILQRKDLQCLMISLLSGFLFSPDLSQPSPI